MWKCLTEIVKKEEQANNIKLEIKSNPGAGTLMLMDKGTEDLQVIFRYSKEIESDTFTAVVDEEGVKALALQDYDFTSATTEAKEVAKKQKEVLENMRKNIMKRR